MKRHHYIFLVFFTLIGVMLSVTVLAGCGEEQQTTTAQQISCDPDAPSIIPAPQGRPMLVEFFRDT